MSKWIWVGFGALALTVAVAAYRDSERKAERPTAARAAAPATPTAEPAAPEAARPGKPPPGEPPEDVLVKFQQEVYDEINRAGGMPVTVTATDKQLVLKPKMYSATKNGCKPVSREPEGTYECSLDMMVTLREGDKKPGQHAERQFLHWDGVSGQWVRGLATKKKRQKG